MSGDYFIGSSVSFEGIDLQSRTRSIAAMDLPWIPADLAGDDGVHGDPPVGLEVDLADVDALARTKAARAEALLWAREARARAKEGLR